ncbi:DNA translocase FtsK [Neochlamydia sp. EPS4]|nr:DNA translocase FtsK [Neochlamydia sp. EPS4]
MREFMAKKKAAKAASEKAPPVPMHSSIYGVVALASTFLIFLSLVSFAYNERTHHWVGLLGYSIGMVFHGIFGLSSYIICGFCTWAGWRLLIDKPIRHIGSKLFFTFLLILSVSMILNVVEDLYPLLGNTLSQFFYPNLWIKRQRYHLGGAPLFYLYKDLPIFNLYRFIGVSGVMVLFTSTLLASLFFIFKIMPQNLILSILRLFSKVKAKLSKNSSDALSALAPLEKKEVKVEAEAKKDSDFMRYVKLRIPGFLAGTHSDNTSIAQDRSPSPELLAIRPEINLTTRPSVSRKEKNEDQLSFQLPAQPLQTPPPPVKKKELANEQLDKREAALKAQRVHNGDFSAYNLPSFNLLTNPKKFDQTSLKKDLKKQAEVLEETLLSFGIEAKVGQINCGPTITSFEVHPAIGVKVQRIKTLENDIALNMEARSIRIIAPIPGKAAVGIEVPNPSPQEVSFKDMLTTYQQGTKKFHIPILLGKAVNGDYVMSDLAKMPHCIIAGATGSGKSVCINTIVMSIVLNARPDEIKLVMVDPKKVELTPYTRLPHMLAPVITEPHGACAALRWMVKEMEKRYEILKQTGVRNIESFNNRAINKDFEDSLNIEVPEKMPYIVGIIDELADLMMVASSDIETPIARIAQMARAIGIHLVLATQRPSREVITGLIKANFPTRISFKVASRINSQIILDETGAESLLGNGDMLFLPPGTSHLVRAQGAFIRDEDIHSVVKYICDQAPPHYVIESFDTIGSISLEDSGGSLASTDAPQDALYDQALDIVLSTGNASTTFLQRKLKIGYARAASLMDQLESQGVVSPAEGSKPRKILAAKQGISTDDDLLEEEENF